MASKFDPSPNGWTRRALASVATHTDAAPAFSRACAAARAVAPVVRMSSINKMCFASTAAGSETEKAARTFKRRWRGVRPAWLPVERWRIKVLDASVSRHCGCDRRTDLSAWVASERAWLNPRSAYFARWRGTGTTSISAGASSPSSAIARASIRPSMRAAG